MHVIPYIEFHGAQWFRNSSNCVYFFGTGNVLEKIQFFMLVLELFLKSEFLTINFLGYNILVGPCLNLLYVIKYYFNSAQSNLNNRSNHQVTVALTGTGCYFQNCDICWTPFDRLLLLLITFLYSEITLTFDNIFSSTVELQIIFNRRWGDNQLLAKANGKVHIVFY